MLLLIVLFSVFIDKFIFSVFSDPELDTEDEEKEEEDFEDDDNNKNQDENVDNDAAVETYVITK